MKHDVLFSLLLLFALTVVPGFFYVWHMRLLPVGEESPIVGTWYGEQPQAGYKYVAWITHRNADGTTEIDFRAGDKCGVLKSIEKSGRWKYGWPFFDVSYEVEEGAESAFSFVNRYWLVWVDRSSMIYWHRPPTSYLFKSRRVPADFKFSGCYAEKVETPGSGWGAVSQ